MENKRYRPLFDKLFWIIFIPTLVLLGAVSIVMALESVWLIFLAVGIDAFVVYFLISPAFGYVELREDALFIKYGFFMKRSIPYKKIRGIKKERRVIAESMLSLKNALEHVNIRYSAFDVTTVSVVDNDGFVRELSARASLSLRD